MDVSLVTPAGIVKLNAELQALRSKRRTLLEELGGRPEAIAVAQLEQQIALLEDRLGSAKVVRADPADGELGIGESVRVRDLDSGEAVEYRIVGAGEGDPSAGSISYKSPVGAALLGRQVGDVVEVEAPRGTLRLEVLDLGL